MSFVPNSHPRHESLYYREKLEEALDEGILAKAGLIAHGRGEALDYILGEKTIEPADKALDAMAASFIVAEDPVISVNGNVTALVPKEITELSKVANAKIEVNLFYKTEERVNKIKQKFKQKDPDIKLYGLQNNEKLKNIPNLDSKRGKVDPNGIWKADMVFVPLEDGDRTEALLDMGKKIITIDLNPLSRTGRKANITVVDNIVRSIPKLTKKIEQMNEKEAKKILKKYDNEKVLSEVLSHMSNRLQDLADNDLKQQFKEQNSND